MHEAACAATGIHALRDMTSMSSLSLAHSQVTDEGLAHIRGAYAGHAPRCNAEPQAAIPCRMRTAGAHSRGTRSPPWTGGDCMAVWTPHLGGRVAPCSAADDLSPRARARARVSG